MDLLRRFRFRTRGALPALHAILGLLLLAVAASTALAQETPVLVLDVGSHTGPLRRISTDPGGRLAVTVSDDKTAMLWDLASGRALRTLRVPVGADESGRLYGAAVAPDGRTVALAGTTAVAGGIPRIYLYDLPSGNFRTAFKALGANVRHLAWSPDGQWLAAAYVGEAALRVFRADGTLVHEVRLPADAYGLSISTAGQLAVSAFDGKVRLFNLGGAGVQAAGEIAVALNDPVGVRHSPDGRLLAVGYFSRAARDRVQVDVYDATTGQSLRSFAFRDLFYGNLMNVGWQADGRALYAGGTGYNDAGHFVVKRISWPEGRSEGATVAGDSIQDFVALPDGRMALASFDATWTVLDGLRPVLQSASLTTRVANATPLKLSPDAATAEWRSAAGEIRSFALAARHPGGGDARTRSPDASSFSLRVSDWENTREPKINGNRVELLANESSRSAALLPGGGGVVLATSRALRRLDAKGAPIWTVPLHTEARSVNVSADGKLVVAALADGTLRWRRADDGAALLSLLLLQDGRWVLWTDAGYFDAGPGSEDLVGWLVPRPGGERADYFGVSRFRDRYLRPDVIDQVLAQRDPERALQVANAQRVQLAQEQANPEVVKSLQSELAPRPLALSLPPVVTLSQLPGADVAHVPRVETSLAELAINYKLFAIDKQAAEKLIVRVDGRPVEATFKQTDIGAGGEAEGRMVIALSKHEGKIQIFAEGPNGTSMPAELDYVSTAPSLQPPVDRRPKLFLLAVGVSRYANPEYSLGLAAKDARDFAHALERQSGIYYQSVETHLLLDEQATRANVLAGLRWLQTVTRPNDMAMLFVAGHGVADAADVYYFLPHDMKDTQVAQTGVSENQLRGTLAAIKGRALFFVDTCFAGKSVGKFTRREITRLANGLASAEMGVIVFSGSAPRQESLEDTAWGNGAFTKALVAGLSGRADFRKEGVVTHKGLDYYVAHEVRTLTQGRQTPVTAVPNGISDFPLAAVPAPISK